MKLKVWLLVLLIQTAYLMGTVIVSEQALAKGKIALLETLPIDPRDLLRGDYIVLNYKISEIPLDLFSPAQNEPLPNGTVVYVILAPRGAYYEAVRASLERAEPIGNEVVLHGRSQYSWSQGRKGSVRVVYGLERFYVAEGKGRPKGKLTVEVAVPHSGRALIRNVFVDGKPFGEITDGG